MRKRAVFILAMVWLLLAAGCAGGEPPVTSEIEPPEVSADEPRFPDPTPEPAALGIAELKDALVSLDPSAATLMLTYDGETKETLPAGAAICAENYMEKLSGLTWEEYTPYDGWNRESTPFCELSTPDMTITSFQSGYGSFVPIHLVMDGREGWFFLPRIQNQQNGRMEQTGSMMFDILSCWYEEAQTASLYGGKGTPLTPEELEYFREYTASMQTEYDAEQHGMIGSTEISCFFTSRYSDPRDMNANDFLYYCPPQDTLTSGDPEEEAEFLHVQKKLDWRPKGDGPITLMDLPWPCHRLPRTYIDEILMQYAGITLDDMNTDWREKAFYIAETDCFYSFASDFGPGMFDLCYGEKIVDTVMLWETFNGYDGAADVLTLRKSGESWHILAHQAVTGS